MFGHEISSQSNFLMSFVYAFNDVVNLCLLRNKLFNFNSLKTDPWIICGDFNFNLNMEESLGGSGTWNSGFEEFKV